MWIYSKTQQTKYLCAYSIFIGTSTRFPRTRAAPYQRSLTNTLQFIY